MIDETLLKTNENIVLDEIKKLQEENINIHKEYLKLNDEYIASTLKNIMFVTIPITIEWDTLDIEDEARKEIIIDKFCKEFVGQPITTISTKLDDYGQMVEYTRAIGVVTSVKRREDNTLSVLGAIWVSCGAQIDASSDLIKPSAVHIDIDYQLNDIYANLMKKNKELMKRIEKTITEVNILTKDNEERKEDETINEIE
jgi:hypothetical protein